MSAEGLLRADLGLYRLGGSVAYAAAESVMDAPNDAYYTVMTTVVSSNESWTDSVRDTGITWSRSYCCSSSRRCHPRSPVLG